MTAGRWAYDAPLARLQAIRTTEAGHLVALVEATTAGSRSRRRAGQAAATVARALDWSEELVSQLRELGKGCSAARGQSPRELPRDEAIEAMIDPGMAWEVSTSRGRITLISTVDQHS